MLDPKEIDRVLENLSLAIIECDCNDSLDLWMDCTFEEIVEFGRLYMYTDDFMPEEYFETLQLMIRFYEKKLDIGRVAMCVKIQKEFLEERKNILTIAPHIIEMAMKFLYLREEDKYN